MVALQQSIKMPVLRDKQKHIWNYNCSIEFIGTKNKAFGPNFVKHIELKIVLHVSRKDI